VEAHVGASKPIQRFFKEGEGERQSLKFFKEQEMEMFYKEKKLKPEVE